jgi:hypothetical protein
MRYQPRDTSRGTSDRSLFVRVLFSSTQISRGALEIEGRIKGRGGKETGAVVSHCMGSERNISPAEPISIRSRRRSRLDLAFPRPFILLVIRERRRLRLQAGTTGVAAMRIACTASLERISGVETLSPPPPSPAIQPLLALALFLLFSPSFSRSTPRLPPSLSLARSFPPRSPSLLCVLHPPPSAALLS